MDKYLILPKTDFNKFIIELAKIKKLFAPVSKGYNNYAFQPVTRADEISIKYIPTILPPKKYFMPQKEAILKFNKKQKEWDPVIEAEPLTIFGVHTCDLAGIQCLNMVFNTDPKDMNYINRKNNISIIGFECNFYCDKYASCAVMDNHIPNGGYDLFLTEFKTYFLIHLNNGKHLIKNMNFLKPAQSSHIKQLEKLRNKKRKIFKPEVKVTHHELKPLFEKSFKSPVWDDLNKRCVACGNCTNVCPTCYCFDIKDDINFDFNTGRRIRIWDSCQTEEFAKVAGGENFRKERGQRQLHRYMRKFNYPVSKYNRHFCTGCGRCSRTCMADINLKETINELAS